MRTIKTKETNNHINTLDKKQDTKFLDRKQDINEKKKDEYHENDSQKYAVNKVVDHEKRTATEVVFRSKQYVKRRTKERNKRRIDKIKDTHNKLEIRTRDIAKTNSQTYNLKLPVEKQNIILDTRVYHTQSKVKFQNYNPDNYSKKMKLFMLRKHKNKVKNANKASSGVKRGIHGVGEVIKGSLTVIRKTVTGINNLITFGTGLILLVVITLFIGVFGALSDDSTINSATLPLNDKVIEYREIIETYARQYEMEEYVALIQAVMMQESGGEGSDPMQSSECEYNEKYPKRPNGITDANYSIEVGIYYLAECFKIAKVDGPYDMEHLSLALQGYNYGKGYISWAIEHFGGYTRANAKVYSDEKKAELQVNIYGDPQYVSHVFQYYHLGNGDIVMVAKSQVGNVGGKPYWQWYGFTSHVEWCACFVSWCANESGQLNITIPKFARVEDGIQWFKGNGKWKDKSYIPVSGDIIFFDWNSDNDPDHVGIVEKVEENIIYTIEGNSKDKCMQKKYSIDSNLIFGYGVYR